MNVLVFEENLNGHRLEYLHHIYMLGIDMVGVNFYFVFSEKFNTVSSLFEWPSADNIHINLIKGNEEAVVGRKSFVKLVKDSWRYAKTINRFVELYNIDRIFAISIITYIPFLCLFLNKKVKVDGILYSIFPSSGRLGRIIDYIKYSFFRFGRSFNKIYTLNDAISAEKINKTLRTEKFEYIPDPYTPIHEDKEINIVKELNISSNQLLFAHFGGLQERKGTMYILESIKMLDDEQRKKYVFVLAGKIYDDIRNEFYKEYNELKSVANIFIKDEFCSYSYLAALCKSSDAILIPYLSTKQSSGLIGYSSQFGTPLIGPHTGTIGRLIESYKLGYCLPYVTAHELVKAYDKVANGQIAIPDSNYCEANSIQNFQNVIRRNLY